MAKYWTWQFVKPSTVWSKGWITEHGSQHSDNFKNRHCGDPVHDRIVLERLYQHTHPPPYAAYNWGDYPAQVYAHFQESSSADQQAAILEKQAQGHQMAPGYYAHLGMLHALIGQTDKAVAELDQEQAFYPESSHYMVLLKRSLIAPVGTPPVPTQANRN